MKYRKNKGEEPAVSEEFNFFVHNPLSKYKGLYVALTGKKVLASGKSAKKVWEQALAKNPKKLPTIAKLPQEEVLIMVWK